MISESPVRWGIVSTGRIAHSFASDFEYVKNGKLTAVASRNSSTAAAFASEYDIANVYGSYRELFESDQVDAVYIATPHTLHLMNILNALDAGKAVLCEKPFTVNSLECERVIKRADETGIFVMEAMWTYFLPAIQKAKKWVEEGRIGQLRHIKADFGYPQLPFDAARREYDKDLAGGCLLEMGIYPIALAWLFSGEDPIDVQVQSNLAPNGVEDDVSILFRYQDSFATLGTSFRCKLQNWAYIIGDEGYIAIPDFWRASECYLHELDTQVDLFKDNRRSIGLNYETDAASAAIRSSEKEVADMPLSTTLTFQRHIDLVRQHIQEAHQTTV